MPTFTRNTPWGPAQTAQDIGRGVIAVTTASHGGLFVPDELLPAISPTGQAEARRWCGSPNWYEEDCCLAYVAVALPELFTGDQLDAARFTLARYPSTYSSPRS
jgi:hypothetical protein